MAQQNESPSGFQPTRIDKRTAFYTARKNGASVSEASRIAGINRATGTRWESQLTAKTAQLSMRGESIATKQEIAQELTRIGLYDSEVAPRDKVNALATASKVLGYDAPTRIEQVSIVASLEQWLDATERRERAALSPASTPTLPAVASASLVSAPAAAKQIAGGGPPIEARAESVTAPQIISQISEKEAK